MKGSIRYAYLTDPENKNRVITIARRLRDEDDGRVMLEYGIAINRVPFENDRSPEKKDRFDKNKARLISSGRLEKKDRPAVAKRGLAGEIEVPSDTKGTYNILLEHLAGEAPMDLVARSAEERIYQMSAPDIMF